MTLYLSSNPWTGSVTLLYRVNQVGGLCSLGRIPEGTWVEKVWVCSFKWYSGDIEVIRSLCIQFSLRLCYISFWIFTTLMNWTTFFTWIFKVEYLGYTNISKRSQQVYHLWSLYIVCLWCFYFHKLIIHCCLRVVGVRHISLLQHQCWVWLKNKIVELLCISIIYLITNYIYEI